jgi:hypothetical protein
MSQFHRPRNTSVMTAGDRATIALPTAINGFSVLIYRDAIRRF